MQQKKPNGSRKVNIVWSQLLQYPKSEQNRSYELKCFVKLLHILPQNLELTNKSTSRKRSGENLTSVCLNSSFIVALLPPATAVWDNDAFPDSFGANSVNKNLSYYIIMSHTWMFIPSKSQKAPTTGWFDFIFCFLIWINLLTQKKRILHNSVQSLG